MPGDARLKLKFENAINITEALIDFLLAVELPEWASRYAHVISALSEGDLSRAIVLRKSSGFDEGQGSLSDLLLEDEEQQTFHRLMLAQDMAIGNIRLFLSHGTDRPLCTSAIRLTLLSNHHHAFTA